MSDMLPLATYSLNVEPYTPTPALNFEMPVTVRITMAAIDPEPFDDDKKPSTLRIIKRNPELSEHEHGEGCNHDHGHDDEEDESDSEEEVPEKTAKAKKGKKVEQSESEQESEDDSEDESEMDNEFEECVLVTLSPKGQYQQTLDITIAPEEDVQFVVTGSYTISLTGNYVKHPFDTPLEDNSSDSDDDEEDYYYSEEESSNGEEEKDDEDLSSGDDELDDLVDASDIESRLDELVEKDEKKKNNKKDIKRKHEEEESAKPAEKKQPSKKAKKAESKKDSEEIKQKPKTNLLEGGIIIEDRVTGKGPHAKKSTRVGMRYVGKLKNGKVFDKNTKGKPFVFKLGHGEVIKGWDIGVAGMAVGGERRIVIPAAYAYGTQALPGIPANSELTFDVKLVSMK